MKIIHIVGARPNFMKATPVVMALKAYPQVEQLLVHTGQHYDSNMSDVFFKELGLIAPDINLDVGSGSHTHQTSHIMLRLEPYLIEQKPQIVVVYGDVNSTVAAALVCAKLLIPVAHVEAGLRSRDRTMPEEINRLLTDQIADLLLTPSEDGNANLINEGVPEEKIHLVGNAMIDTLVRLLPEARKRPVLERLQLPARYALVTLHRPSNVDDPDALREIVTTLAEVNQKLPIVLPIHPRTRQRINDLQIDLEETGIHVLEPLGYLDFLALQTQAALVITDSGGIQEETTYLGIPCITVRENTERPVTIDVGTNQLIGRDMTRLRRAVDDMLRGSGKKGSLPPLWDGQTGQRIAEIIVNYRK